MDPTARILALAPLLYPAHSADALDVRLARTETGAIEAALYDCGIDSPLAYATADNGAAAIDALAAALVVATYARSDALLRAAGDDAPPPVPSREELAARLAEAERQLADSARVVTSLEKLGDAAANELNRVCGQHVTTCEAICRLARGEALPVDPGFDAAAGPLATDALRRVARTLAARVDHEPPQRAPGVVAGVAADDVAEFARRLRALAHDLAHDISDAAREARQRACGGEGRGERVERGQQGAADVGGVAEAVERVVVCEGVVTHAPMGSPMVGGDLVAGRIIRTLAEAITENGGQRVRVVVEVLRGEGGSVHGESVSPTVATREAQS